MPTRHSTVGWDFPRSSTRRITQDSSARKAGPPFRFRSRRAASKTAQSCTSRVDDWVEELVERGIEFDQPPTDMRYLWREAVLHDPSGNRIKLYHAGDNRRHPPWRVEIGD